MIHNYFLLNMFYEIVFI